MTPTRIQPGNTSARSNLQVASPHTRRASERAGLGRLPPTVSDARQVSRLEDDAEVRGPVRRSLWVPRIATATWGMLWGSVAHQREGRATEDPNQDLRGCSRAFSGQAWGVAHWLQEAECQRTPNRGIGMLAASLSLWGKGQQGIALEACPNQELWGCSY